MAEDTTAGIAVSIIEERENPLLGRREVRFRLTHPTGTPSRQQVRAALQAALKARPELLVVDGMRSSFGRGETKGYAKVYATEERAKQVERKHILARNFPEIGVGGADARPPIGVGGADARAKERKKPAEKAAEKGETK